MNSFFLFLLLFVHLYPWSCYRWTHYQSSHHKCGRWHRSGRDQGICQGIQAASFIVGSDPNPSGSGVVGDWGSRLQPKCHLQVRIRPSSFYYWPLVRHVSLLQREERMPSFFMLECCHSFILYDIWYLWMDFLFYRVTSTVFI